jgi:type II secretory pathway component PulJ
VSDHLQKKIEEIEERLQKAMDTFDERIDRAAVIARGQTPEAAESAYILARSLEFAGDSHDTQRALNAYWKSVGADV